MKPESGISAINILSSRSVERISYKVSGDKWSGEQMLVKHAFVVLSLTVKLRDVPDTLWKAVTFQLKITLCPLRELEVRAFVVFIKK